jgi:ribosomal protein L15
VQGYFKVLGKGRLPSVPLVVKARFFSKGVRASNSVIMMLTHPFSLLSG